MTDKQQNSGQGPIDPMTLCRKAEAQARNIKPLSLSTQPPEEIQRMLHELQARQIELEMQNKELRRTQAELDDSRTRYLNLYDHAPVGYCTLSELGMIQEVNLTAATLLGTTRDELTTQPLARFVHHDDQDIFDLHHRQILETGTLQKCDLRLIKPNDGYIWAHLQGTVDHADDSAPLIRMVISDISERKRAEAALIADRNRLEYVINATRLATWAWNLQTNETIFNETWATMLGYTLEELTPTDIETWIALTHPEDIKKAQALLAPCLAGETEEYICELRMKHKNGHWVWILDRGRVMAWDETGKPLSMFGTHDDISERKLAEEENRKFRVIADSAVYGKAIADLQGHFLYVNRFFADLHGYTPEELIGKPLSVFHSPEQMEAVGRINASLVREGYYAPTTVWHRHQDGTEFPMLMSGVLIKDNLGSPQCIATSAIDVSAQYQAETKLAESEEILRDIVESTLSGFWDWNLVDNTEYLSPTFKRMFGYEDHEMENSPEAWQKIIFPEDLPGVLEVFHRHVESRGREPFYNEIRYRHRDGSTVWVICAGRVIEWADDGAAIRMVGCHIDITGRKRAEESLREREEKYRLIFNMGVNAMFLVDNDTTQILECNNKACQLFGYSPEKLLTMKMTDLSTTPEATRQACRGNVSKQERVYQKKDGRLMSVEVTSEHFYLANRALHIAAITDITDKKQAEKALKESEERFNLAMDASRDGVYEWDLETREIYYSPGWKRMLGYEPNELPDDFSVWEKLTRPEDVVKSWQIMQEVVEGKRERFEVEFEMRHKEGHWIHVLSRANIYKNASGKFARVVGTHVDITESKHQKARLSLSESRYRKAQALAKVGNWEYNLKTTAYWGSDEAKNIYGMDPDQDSFTTEEVESCIIERERVHQALVDLIEKGKPYNLEFDIITKNTGEKKTIVSIAEIEKDGAQNPIKIAGVIHDITERKRAEEELRRRENQLQRIFEILPIGLWFTDKEGTLLRGNPMGVQIWGAEPNVPISEYGVFKAWHLPSRQPVQAEEWALAKTIRNSETIVDELLEIESFDGKRKTILNYTAPVLDGDGQLDGAIVVNLDISDRKALEEQLIQAQKMESIGQLAGGVAHDFNNMLGVILGYSEMTLEQVSPGHPMYKALHGIQQAAQRSADLTRQLLTFARKQTIAPKRIELNETVEGMLKMLRRLIGEDIDLIWLPGRNLHPIKMDPTQIDQILANLCVNARDAIKGVGKVTIETSNMVFDEEYCAQHAGFLPGEYVLLAVSDNGCGMDRKTINHLFEPFFTTKEQGQGTGLGLASVYGAVTQNKGFVNVYSEIDQGTTFKIYLRAYVEKSAGVVGKAPELPAVQGSETILLVEDESAILEMTMMMLEKLGYTVLTAATPGEAIRLAHEHSGSIDLLMTDVVMPEMNGRELTGNLLTHYPNLKRLFMSGYTANVIAHHGVLDPGVHFIQKPFTMKDLGRKLGEALNSS